MGNRVRFTVTGEPVGKGRPIVVRRGEGSMAFTPVKTVLYENLVKIEYQRQCGNARFADDAQLRMRIAAFFAVAKSDSAKKRRAKLDGEVRPTKKPDIDNINKVIADALNGVAYRDDSRIVSVSVDKYYGANPMVVVEIEEV